MNDLFTLDNESKYYAEKLPNKVKNFDHLIIALMKYSIDTYKNNNTFEDIVDKIYEDQILQYKKIKFIKMLCYNAYIPSLLDVEKNVLKTKEINEIYDYIIDKTIKINKIYPGFDNGIKLLQDMKNDHKYLEHLDDEKKFIENFIDSFSKLDSFISILNNKQIFGNHEVFSSDGALQKLKEGNYISIDIISANYSMIIYYFGQFKLGIKPSYLGYEDFTKTFTQDKYLYSNKNLRGIAFGKLLKKYDLWNIYVNELKHIIMLVIKLLESNNFVIGMKNLDEVVIENNNYNVQDIQNLINTLDIGLMTTKFRIEPFVLTKNGKVCIKKMNDHIKCIGVTPSLYS